MEAAILEAPAPVQTEVPVLQPSVAEILNQHLDHSQQKKIAVENLSSIKFLIAAGWEKRSLSQTTSQR